MKLLTCALVLAVATLSLVNPLQASAATKYKLSGSIAGSNVADAALLISKSTVTRVAVKNNKFDFGKVTAATLKNARLYFFKDGSPIGPGALKESSGAKYLTFSGKVPARASALAIKFKAKTGYLVASPKINDTWISKTKVSNSKFTGASLGYAGAVVSSLSTGPIQIKDSASDASVDSDGDGVPDVLDIDDDNDGIPDDRDSGGGSMISTMYLNFASTINAHLENLNDTSIANTLSAEGVFGLTFFIQLNGDLASATGGHVVCDSSQVICRRASDGGTTSYYTGVSESNPAVQNQIWSNFNSDGSGKPNLEVISFGGSNHSLVAAIQPRTASFQAGEIITANVTNGTRILGTKIFSILPPVISSPALVSYNAGAGTTTVNYSDATAPGSSDGFPITMTGNSMTFNFYPPQRKAIVGVESDGAYRDIGQSRMGVVLGGTGISQEFTCAGYYSGLSTGLTEADTSVSLPGGNIYSHSGALVWPITDATADTVSSSGTLKSFTVDLAHCLARGGASPGTYLATLMYAGSDTNFGAPRSGQNIYVTIPAPS